MEYFSRHFAENISVEGYVVGHKVNEQYEDFSLNYFDKYLTMSILGM